MLIPTWLALSLASVLSGAPRVAPAPVFTVTPQEHTTDAWFGDDKLRHFTMSFAATSFANGAARSLGVKDGAAEASAAAALAAGIGKEIRDARSGGFFSVRDLAWDIAGVIAGYAVARNTR